MKRAACEDIELLQAIMLRAELFCSHVEAGVKKFARDPKQDSVRLKINQCRGGLVRLQTLFDKNELTITNRSVRDELCHLVTALMWVAFHARVVVDYKIFRMLVMIESSVTHLLSAYFGRLDSTAC